LRKERNETNEWHRAAVDWSKGKQCQGRCSFLALLCCITRSKRVRRRQARAPDEKTKSKSKPHSPSGAAACISAPHLRTSAISEHGSACLPLATSSLRSFAARRAQAAGPRSWRLRAAAQKAPTSATKAADILLT